MTKARNRGARRPTGGYGGRDVRGAGGRTFVVVVWSEYCGGGSARAHRRLLGGGAATRGRAGGDASSLLHRGRQLRRRSFAVVAERHPDCSAGAARAASGRESPGSGGAETHRCHRATRIRPYVRRADRRDRSAEAALRDLRVPRDSRGHAARGRRAPARRGDRAHRRAHGAVGGEGSGQEPATANRGLRSVHGVGSRSAGRVRMDGNRRCDPPPGRDDRWRCALPRRHLRGGRAAHTRASSRKHGRAPRCARRYSRRSPTGPTEARACGPGDCRTESYADVGRFIANDVQRSVWSSAPPGGKAPKDHRRHRVVDATANAWTMDIDYFATPHQSVDLPTEWLADALERWSDHLIAQGMQHDR